MKQEQVQIGQVYAAKISGKPAPVRIDAEHPGGGWHATNTHTNRKVRIKSADQLTQRPSPGKPARAVQDNETGGGDGPTPAREPAKKKLSTAERRARTARAKAPAPAEQEGDGSGAGKGKPAKREKPARPNETPKRPSLIEAAAQVLGESKEPMDTKAMVREVAARGLWSPRNGGKTPHATLYSAILRDMRSDKPRFEKAARGHFILAKGADLAEATA